MSSCFKDIPSISLDVAMPLAFAQFLTSGLVICLISLAEVFVRSDFAFDVLGTFFMMCIHILLVLLPLVNIILHSWELGFKLF